MMGPCDPDEAARLKQQPNVWPVDHRRNADQQRLKPALETYYKAAAGLEADLKMLLAESLDLPSSFFSDSIGNNAGLCRANYYPSLAEHGNEMDLGEQGGMAAHSDLGTITLLISNSPGLEVICDGAWSEVLWEHGTVCVNLGDFFRLWTNGAWKSSIHRVTLPTSGGSRASVAYFADQCMDVSSEAIANAKLVKPIPSFMAADAQEDFKAVSWPAYFRMRTASFTTGAA